MLGFSPHARTGAGFTTASTTCGLALAQHRLGGGVSFGGLAEMATPRKRWVKQPTSIIRETWPRDVKLTAILLSCWLGDRWARDGLSWEEAAHATLTRDQLHTITGRSQIAHARRALRALRECVSITIRVRKELTEIHWPKWAEYQAEVSGHRASMPPRASPSAPAPAEDTKKATANAAPRRRRRPPARPGEHVFGSFDYYRANGHSVEEAERLVRERNQRH